MIGTQWAPYCHDNRASAGSHFLQAGKLCLDSNAAQIECPSSHLFLELRSTRKAPPLGCCSAAGTSQAGHESHPGPLERQLEGSQTSRLAIQRAGWNVLVAGLDCQGM